MRKSTARLIRDYCEQMLTECVGDDEQPPAIDIAVREAVDDEEVEHLGRALLVRNECLADLPYRFGGDNYDPRLREIAARLGWAP